jgi:hypothetical protein
MSNISLLCGMLFKVIPRFSLIKSTLYFYFMSIQNFGFIYLLVTFTLWRSGPKLDGYFFTFTLTFSTILRITLYFYFVKVKKPQSKEKTKYKVKISKKSPTPVIITCTIPIVAQFPTTQNHPNP